jgi:hypothetical protein
MRKHGVIKTLEVYAPGIQDLIIHSCVDSIGPGEAL